jgi:hypothetical protein
VVAVGCGSDDVDSDEEARRAYLGLDKSIEKALNLGFAGFNAATSANIPDQMGAGDAAGMLVISGQVDSGMSANKTMRLNIGMVDYDDGEVPYNEDGDTVHIVYDTNPDKTMQPYLDLKLNDFPDGTVTGTLSSNSTMTGVYTLDGDIIGELTLQLNISGPTMAGAVAGDVVRVPGMTMVTGTATNSDGGVYDISLSI